MDNVFRAVFAGAVILMSSTSGGYAQQANGLPPVPPAILAQLNQSAATQPAEAFARVVATIAAANPSLAAAIAGKATEIRPAAAIIVAENLAVIVPLAQAASVVQAMIDALPPSDMPSVGATVINSYIAAAPDPAQSTLAVALASIIGEVVRPAAGQANPIGNDNRPSAG